MTNEVNSAEAVQLGATSLILFGKLFFPRTFRQDSPDFHREIGLHLYGPARYNAFKIFRDGAKTTLLRVYIAQRIAYDISRTIMCVSVSQPHSIMTLRWLKKQIERNQTFAGTFGLKPGAKWTDEWLEVKHTVTNDITTVLAAGITGQIRGYNIDDYRPDLIIGDDLCNEENTATPEQRSKTANLWFGALYNSLAPTSEAPLAKMALLQTPLNREDLIETCSKSPHWNTLTYGVFDEEGHSRLPSRWTTDVLVAEKNASTAQGNLHIWMREKECRLVSSDIMPFDVTNIQYYETPPAEGFTIISVDPASSESKTADDTAILAVRLVGQKVYLLDAFAEKGVMPDAAAAKFFEFVWKYNPIKGVIETISYQRILKWFFEQEMMRRRLFIPLDEVKDKRKKHDRIMQALSEPLRFRNVYVRKNDDSPGVIKFLQQLTDFSPGIEMHDDVLDALAMAITSVNPAQRYAADVQDMYSLPAPVKELELFDAP